jgi:hypothetical protein
MSDPQLHPFARDLVGSCKDDAPPNDGAERMIAAMGIAVAAPLAVPAAKAVHGAITKAVFAKWVTVAAIAGVATGAGGYHVGRERLVPVPPPPPAVTVYLPAPPAPPPPIEPTPTAAAPEPPSPVLAPARPRAPEPSASAAPAPPPLPADRELEREMAQVTYTRSLIDKKQYAEALQAIAAYRANLGKVLEPEMRALEVEATFGLGKTAEGKRLAESFLEDYPRHPAAARVRGFLATSPR